MLFRRFRLFGSVFSLAVLLGFFGIRGADASVSVVTSIEPLRGIASAIMGESGSPFLIVAGKGSPHDYAMTTKAAEALAQADVVLWIGPEMEGFMKKPLASLSGKAEVITAMTLEGMTLLPSRHGGIWGSEEEEEEHEEHGNHEGVGEEDHHHHSHGLNDPHVWMSPDNAKVIARRLAQVLGQKDPANKELYENNLAAFLAQVDAVDARVRAKLAEQGAQASYLVYHDAFQYFEKHYGLVGAGSVVQFPEEMLSANRMAALTELLAQKHVTCLFLEPQFEHSVPDALVQSGKMRVAVADPLESPRKGSEQDRDVYVHWLESLADSLTACLSGANER